MQQRQQQRQRVQAAAVAAPEAAISLEIHAHPPPPPTHTHHLPQSFTSSTPQITPDFLLSLLEYDTLICNHCVDTHHALYPCLLQILAMLSSTLFLSTHLAVQQCCLLAHVQRL
jgi:hypothetical protein